MKTEKVYWTISEVSDMTGITKSNIRFWESEFNFLNPKRSKGNERRYRINDIEIIKLIDSLINDLGMKLGGVRKAFDLGYEKDLERIIKKHEKREKDFEFAKENEHQYE